MKISIGILAGSKSHGRNQAKLKVNNRLTVRKLTYELSSFEEVLIAAACKGDYEDLGCEVVYDSIGGIGPIEGLHNILAKASSEYVFVCGADMPMLKKDLIEYMSEFVSSDYDCYCLTDDDHMHPLCAIYSKDMLPLIESAIEAGDYKLINVIRKARTKYIKLEYTCFDKRILRNTLTREHVKDVAQPVVFCVSGAKNTGKTGLIIRLINEFINDGYSVGAIKHDGHDYVMDHKDTDTYRFAEAGAERSIIFSESQFSLNGKGKRSVGYMLKFCDDLDVVIMEGLKALPYPKVEMISGDSEGLCDSETLICRATDDKFPHKDKVFNRDDIEGIFLCIKKYFSLE